MPSVTPSPAPLADLLALARQHHEAGNYAEAERLYRQVLSLDARHWEAFHLLANVRQAQGQFAEAVELYRRLLRVAPGYPSTHNNLAIALTVLGETAEAEFHFREAIRLKPDYSAAWNNLGLCRQNQGQFDEAESCYRSALNLDPQYADAHNNLGNVLARLGKLDEAGASYEAAIRGQPDFAVYHNNLAGLRHAQGRLDEAVALYEEALRLSPDYAEACNNLGAALQAAGRLSEGLAWYRKALELQFDYAEARSNLVLSLNYDPDTDAETLVAEHRRWADMHGRRQAEGNCLPSRFENLPDPERSLKVGYVSIDFRQHPVAFFMEPILVNHDCDSFESLLYADVSAPDATTARLRSLAGGWRNITGLTDAQAAEQIRRDGIDILIDLGGHTAHNRLGIFTYQSAPVPIAYLGYPFTTGLRTIQYRLTDAIADPPDESSLYSEELVRLPRTFGCYAPPAEAPAVSSLPARGGRGITFGSLHNLTKLNSQVIDLWSRVLAAVPGSRLLMFRDMLAGSTEDFFRRAFVARGIPADRIELCHELPKGRATCRSMTRLTLRSIPSPGPAIPRPANPFGWACRW